MPPSSCGRRPLQHPYPTTTPPQPSGGASSTSYRRRRTKNPQPLRRSRRPGARRRHHAANSAPSRARRPLPRSARAAETSRRITTPQMCFGGLLPNPMISIHAVLRAPASAPHVSLPLRAAPRRAHGDALRGPSPGNCPVESYGNGSPPGCAMQVERRGPTRWSACAQRARPLLVRRA
jgi:hypothetical protein